MRTEYQKRVVNFSDDFNWKELGEQIVFGGLLKNKQRHDLFKFVKHADNELSACVLRKRSRIEIKRPVDLYHHSRYISLEYLRGVYQELQVGGNLDQDFLIKMVDLKKRILNLEKDLEIHHNEIVVPGKHYRFTPGEPFLIENLIKFDPYGLPSTIKHKFYKSGLIPAQFTNNTPYVLPVFPNLAPILKKRHIPNNLYDINYWLLVYNKSLRASSFLTPFRNTLNNYNKYSALIKALNQNLKNLRSFKLNYFKQSYSRMNNSTFDVPFRVRFSELILYSTIYVAKRFNKSLSVAKNNRHYILSSTKKDKFKIDIKNYKEAPKKKVKTKNKNYQHTGVVLYDVGQLNLTSYVTLSIKRLTSADVYSELPTSQIYHTQHFKTKRRLRLKDTYAGKQIQSIRDSVFDSIKSKFKPIYYGRPSKSLAYLAYLLLNYKSRHHHRLRSSDSPLSTRQKRLHRLLIVQGIVFEYWVDKPSLMLPGQIVQLQLQNYTINKSFSRPNPEQNLDIEILGTEFNPTLNVEDVKERVKLKSTKLEGYYFYKFLMLKSITKLYYLFRRSLSFVGLGIISGIHEICFIFLIFFDIFKYIFDTVFDFFFKVKQTPFIMRLQALSTIWNTSAAIDDDMFDINDHLSANHKYRHPFQEGFGERFIASTNDLSYVDLDDEHPDDYENSGSSRYYRSNFDFDWIKEFGEDFWDDIVEFIIVDLPYYILLFLRPIFNLIIAYPFWLVLNFVTEIYARTKIVINPDKRIYILLKWLLKTLSLIFYMSFCLIIFDYNDLQNLVCYSLDATFYEFYYVLYVMFVVLSGGYMFGHHSFRTFIRDELGFENLSFLTFSTGSVVVQNYDIASKPFTFTKKIYDYVKPKHMVDKLFLENWSRIYKNDKRGSSNNILSGNPLEQHYSLDNVEFLIDLQLWRDNYRSAGWNNKHQQLLNSKFERKKTITEFTKFDLFDDMFYTGPLFSDLHNIYKSDKQVKTYSWYNNNEHYYQYSLYNRQGLIRKADGGALAYAPEISNFFKPHQTHIGPYRNTFSRTYLRRPGFKDSQSNRLSRVADPALHSTFE